jgi:hypothetical protein
MQPISRERNDKYIPPATYSHGTIEEPVSNQLIGEHTIGVLLETLFSVSSMQSGYKKEFSWQDLVEFLPGYELGSRAIELEESPEVADGRIIEMMAREELDCAKKASCVI